MILSPLYRRLMEITAELTKSSGFPEELCRTTLELAINVNNFSILGQMAMKLATTHKKAAEYQLV
jgi:hypothetical protein